MGVDGARWLLRTSNPLCLVTSGVGGFDSLALPPDIYRHEITRFQPIGKPSTVMVGGFFFGNTELSMELWTVIAGISGFDD